MKIPYFQVDSFTGSVFSGNPAGVCILEHWPDDAVLLSIAMENNLSETAFIIQKGDNVFDLRWFTPAVEVDLCGHATLASAFVIFEHIVPSKNRIRFNSKSGLLTVDRMDGLISMDFPRRPLEVYDNTELLVKALGRRPAEVFLSDIDCLAVFNSEEYVRDIEPDIQGLCELDCQGVIVTAEGSECDFVSRYFGPRVGIYEDPVTGSAHCTLVPYWSKRLKKTSLHALQISSRGGELFCEDHGSRVQISGKAVEYLKGTIAIQ